MKTIVLVLAFAAYVTAKSLLSDDEKSLLEAHGKECIAATGVSEEVVKSIRGGKFTDAAKEKEYFVCMGKKIGFVNDAGEFQTSVIDAKLGPKLGDEQIKKVFGECSTKVQDKPAGEERNFELAKCFFVETHTALF